MGLRVLMFPKLSDFDNEESGIKRVIEAYHKYGYDYGINYINCDLDEIEKYDLYAIHAGSSGRYISKRPLVSHLHGLYWTADYQAQSWEWRVNAVVIETIRHSEKLTVPSSWVAETIQRDLHIDPFVLPHGIESEEWDHDYAHEGYVLWNKNRDADVCTPYSLDYLARKFPGVRFMSTFSNEKLPNIKIVGLLKHKEMKIAIQKAMIYLSSAKETFGIGTLEAMASGVPVLGFAHGGNLVLVEHGINGYLAKPGDHDDLARGLEYCVKFRDILGDNGKAMAKNWTWQNAVKILSGIYNSAYEYWLDNQRPFTMS